MASYTLEVTAAPRVEARAATKGHPEIKLLNGKPVMHLTPELSAQSLEAPQGTLIFVSARPQSGALGFTVSAPGVLEPPSGIYHMPRNVLGLLLAVHPGTVTVSVWGTPRPVIAPLTLPSTSYIQGSSNWAGYSIGGGPFLSIAGSWTVPTVYGDGGDHSAAWIGIDGDLSVDPNSKSLIQVGTSQDYSHGFLGTGLGGGPSYYAWWEVLPDSSHNFSNPVSPGDHMLAIISLSGDPHPGSPMTWLIFLNNQTQNWIATQTVTYSGTLSTAEWIVERPVECGLFSCGLSSLADFSSVTFDGFDLVNSTNPGLAPSDEIAMAGDTSGPAIAVPSDPDGDTDGFTVAYGSRIPPPPGPMIVTTTLPDAFLNFPYQTQLSAVGASSFVWSSSPLPPGLALDPNTGLLSGTPTAAGTFFFSVTARDASDQNISSKIVPLSLNVQTNPPAPDFSLSAEPVVVHLGTGCIGSTTITVTPLFGFNSFVQLSASGPSVTNPHFNPPSTSATSHFTFNAPCSGTLDNNIVVIKGTSGAITHTTIIDVVPLIIRGCNLPGHPPLRVCPPTP